MSGIKLPADSDKYIVKVNIIFFIQNLILDIYSFILHFKTSLIIFKQSASIHTYVTMGMHYACYFQPTIPYGNFILKIFLCPF